jgi:hypothetical protein
MFTDMTDTTYRVRNLNNNESFVFGSAKEPGFLAFDVSNEIVLKQASLVVGADDKTIEKLFQVNPNPASDKINVGFVVHEPQTSFIDVYKADGSLALSHQVKVFQIGLNNVSLDVSALPVGFYTLVLRGKRGIDTGKVMITR